MLDSFEEYHPAARLIQQQCDLLADSVSEIAT